MFRQPPVHKRTPMKKSLRLSLLVLLTFFMGCSHRPPVANRPQLDSSTIQHWKNKAVEIRLNPLNDQEKQSTHLVIFIHGATTFIPSLSAFRHAWQQSSDSKTNESFYQHYQNKIRFGGYRKNQPIGIKGLWRIEERENPAHSQKTIHSAETFVLANLYKTSQQHVHNAKKENLVFYTFGWDGSLSHPCRKQWAHMLYRSLIKLRARIRQNNPAHEIKITIVGHSHGGNVALNLAWFEMRYAKKLIINELILMGTPIQSETRHLAEHPMFRRVCNLYSTGDWVQKLDCISTRDFFSRRTFGTRKKHVPRALPSRITDIEVRVGDYRPAHAEFWFLGGILHFFYRNNFPLYPYPILAFIPIILEILAQAPSNSGNLKLFMEKQENFYFFSLFDKQFHSFLPKQFWTELYLPKNPQRAL